MKKDRLQELMDQVGMPDSVSLMNVLLQVENETEQRLMTRIENETFDRICDYLDEHGLGLESARIDQLSRKYIKRFK